MAVSGSFIRRNQINVKGEIVNAVIVYDITGNTAAKLTAAAGKKYQGLNLSNFSDNYAKATVKLSSSLNEESTHDLLLLPNSSENYDFEGNFVTEVSIVAVNPPTTVGLTMASALITAAGALEGLVSIDLLEA